MEEFGVQQPIHLEARMRGAEQREDFREKQDTRNYRIAREMPWNGGVAAEDGDGS